MMSNSFWRDKRVFVTGHTGFKGAWLCTWLISLGATVTGYSVDIPTQPALFDVLDLKNKLTDIRGDVRDKKALLAALNTAQPEIVFHLAAQPLVIESYQSPVETFETNVLGTVNLLEALRHLKSAQVCVNVTTDKCYDNAERYIGYKENEPLGGKDPYSASKACSELVTQSYRESFFTPGCYDYATLRLASARAGNVIGGGDWAENRLVPDCMRSFSQGKDVTIRYPHAVRPWQHVLEPLTGYMVLAQHLYQKGEAYATAYNFGPQTSDNKTVGWVVAHLAKAWGSNATATIAAGQKRHEAGLLMLDIKKARAELNWQPRWTIETAISKTANWYKAYNNGDDMWQLTLSQIEAFEALT